MEKAEKVDFLVSEGLNLLRSRNGFNIGQLRQAISAALVDLFDGDVSALDGVTDADLNAAMARQVGYIPWGVGGSLWKYDPYYRPPVSREIKGPFR
ncbi:hypothetical protein [Azospirillum aestuarii]|uniref:hypothetical protein n=1 Tax=Azospirillum aestuarii TaxID=2802052 RepID=UPI004054C8D5